MEIPKQGSTPKFILFLKFYKLGPCCIRLPITKYCSNINNMCLKEKILTF